MSRAKTNDGEKRAFMKSIAGADFANRETLASGGLVHIIGAGPVGLFLTALLDSIEGFSVRLYEKRPTYTRTRRVKLSPYLAADSIESYCADNIDGENIEAVFDVSEFEESLAFRQSIPADLMLLIREWVAGFLNLKTFSNA